MRKILFYILFLSAVAFNLDILSQIKISQAPNSEVLIKDNVFTGTSSFRKFIPFNSGWFVYPEGEQESKTKINIPASFSGTDKIVFEKNFTVSDSLLINNRIYLNCLSVNYSPEIYLNGQELYKSPWGNIPFEIEIPEGIIKSGEPNELLIIVKSLEEAEETIPLKNGFLFPKSFNGITGDIYLKAVPRSYVSKFDVEYLLNNNFSSVDVKINLASEIQLPAAEDSIVNINNGRINISVTNPQNRVVFSSGINTDSIENNQWKLSSAFNLNNPALWSPEIPNLYKITAELFIDGVKKDELIKEIQFYSLGRQGENLYLNGSRYLLQGTTYSVNDLAFTYDVYEKIKRELDEIRGTGFNSIRLVNFIPHPYVLRYAQKKGLFIFTEIPVYSAPRNKLESSNFNAQVTNFSKLVTSNLIKDYPVAAVGIGGSFIPNQEWTEKFIENIASSIKLDFKGFVFASFIGVQEESIKGVDLYGVELYAKTYSQKLPESAFKNSTSGKTRTFISSAAYPKYNGSKNGYLNDYSHQAQAKYFSDLIAAVKENNHPAFFINTYFNYSGERPSLFAGYNENSLYDIGLKEKQNTQNTISYNAVSSLLHNRGKVSIPVGTKKDEQPVFFLISALILSIIMTLVINSKRKFRENATRALLRPYNFFADIRDRRILTGFHSGLLLIILAGAAALLLVNFLYFFRTNILLEKILVAVESKVLTNFIMHVAWNPESGLLYLFIFSIAAYTAAALLIKAFAVFVKNRVDFAGVFAVCVWAFLPLTLLLPLELVLYRLLSAETFNLYIYIFTLVFFLWLFQRLLKGVYVIFDVHPFKVHFYGILFIVIVIGVYALYAQYTGNTISYILNSIDQYRFIK